MIARLVLSCVTSLKRLQWNMAALCCFHQDISTMADTFPMQDTPSSSKRRGSHVPLLAVLIAIMMLKAIQQAFISSHFQRTSSSKTDGTISWTASMERTDSSSQNQLFCAQNISKKKTSKKPWQVAGDWWKVCNVCMLFCCCLGTVRKPLSRCLLWFLIFGLAVFILWLFPP